MEVPARIQNRPGLSAISYRVGIHPQFKESLLKRLSNSRWPALSRLTSRSDSDFTIALLDAWATVADVLTFYQERIANESYLATATERFSILELARLLGYELNPGVAASTYLAFTLEENSLVTGQMIIAGKTPSKIELPFITIEVGTKVQSIPEKDEQPQTYETIAAIEARPEWNAIRPQQSQPQLNTVDKNLIIIKGIVHQLKVGDVLYVGDLHLKRILGLRKDNASQTTWLYLSQNASLCPFTAPNSYEPNGKLEDFEDYIQLNHIVVSDILSKTWTAGELYSLLKKKGWSAFDLRESMQAGLEENGASIGQLLVFRKRAAVFGYNAVKKMTYTSGIPNTPDAWDEWTLNESEDEIFLETVFDEILPDTKIAVQKSGKELSGAKIHQVSAVNTRTRSEYGISAKTTAITISANYWWDTNKSDLSAIRSLIIYAQSEPLPLASLPIEKPVSGSTILLDQLYWGLRKNQCIALSGKREDLPGTSASEIQEIQEVYIHEGKMVLQLKKDLTYSYIRKSLTINANVALATHGETVKEMLGSGDARAAFQKFILKHKPLTFVSSTSTTGNSSTLEVRVNELLWKEVPSFYNRGPEERIYITRQNDVSQTTVMFGDGVHGARLPSGQQNIQAIYRKGIGTAALLKANQLTQLITRPLGVKAVDNPIPTNGSQDPERLADARRNVNLPIFTLGRIVSLQDYEDHARAFAGIAKAQAVWAWCGQKQGVFITVAGPAGQPIKAKSTIHNNLLSAIQKASIPGTQVVVKSFDPVFFRLKANIKVHPDFLVERILSDAKADLCQHFAFDERSLGQSVSLSEVYATIQQVVGVLAVDIDHFYLKGDSSIEDRLPAHLPQPGTTDTTPAQLLTIDPDFTVLSQMS